MKSFLIIACLLLRFTYPFAQDNTTGKPLDCVQSSICNYDLYCDKGDNNTLPEQFSLIVSSPQPISYAKSFNPYNYPGDIAYADENNGYCTQTLSDDEFCNHNTNVLKYVVYYPKPYNAQDGTGYDYSQCPLPIYINVHGGGFSDCNDNAAALGDNALCEAMAKRGFVVFNVNYRLGVKLANSTTIVSAQQQLGIYRASQDVRGAIRSIIRMQQDQNNGVLNAPITEYQINLKYIFLGGNSAGSVTVLNVAYYPTQTEVDMINPSSGNAISDALGDIEAPFYYGGTGIEYRSKIKGVLDEWGSVSIPASYYDINDPSKAMDFFANVHIPVICFHGLLDQRINIDIKALRFATPNDNDLNHNPPLIFNSESSCLRVGFSPFQTENSNSNNPDIYTYGSRAFFKYVLQPSKTPSELYIDCEMGHGLDKTNGSTYKSDFGTCYQTKEATSQYIAARAAVFFQSIIAQQAIPRQNRSNDPNCSPCGPPTHKLFLDCLNTHNQCNLGNADAGCTPNLTCSDIPNCN